MFPIKKFLYPSFIFISMALAGSCTFYETPIPAYEEETIIIGFVKPESAIFLNFNSGEGAPGVKQGVLYKNAQKVDTFKFLNDTTGYKVSHKPTWNSTYSFQAELSDGRSYSGHVSLPKKPRVIRIPEEEIPDSAGINGLRFRQGLVIKNTGHSATIYLSLLNNPWVNNGQVSYFLGAQESLTSYYANSPSAGDTIFLYSNNSLDTLHLRWHGAADYRFSIDQEGANSRTYLNYQQPATINNLDKGKGLFSYYYDYSLGR